MLTWTRMVSCTVLAENLNVVVIFVVTKFLSQNLSMPTPTVNLKAHHDVAMRYWIVFMHMAYKSSTPKKFQDYMHAVCNNEVKGPRLRVGIAESILVEEPSRLKTAVERLKNYEASSIDMSKIDGMHSFTYTPPSDDVPSPDFSTCFDDMFNEIKETTPESFEMWFEDSTEGGTETHVSAKSRLRLRPFVDTAYKLADRLGENAQKHLEEKTTEFNDWCSVQLSEKDDKKTQRENTCHFHKKSTRAQPNVSTTHTTCRS